MKIFTKEVKIALAAIVALVLLFFGLNFLKGLTMFSNTTQYKMVFSDLKGLSKSTGIFANGYKVGTVTDILYDYDNVGEDITVLCDLDPKLRLPMGTKATIDSDLMGNIKVILIPGEKGAQKMEPGSVIQGINDEGMMAKLGEMMPTVEAMLPKLDSIVTSLNNILADPAIPGLLHNMNGMSANLKNTTAELNTMMSGLNKSVPGILQHTNNTLANTETLTGRLNEIDINATMAKIDNTLSNVESMTRALNNREGTLGMFMYDKGVYNNLNSTMMHADSLMIDLKEHPKRYVHFSIFGKKDK